MKTFLLITLPAMVLVALLVLYLRRASGRSRGRGEMYESLAARFGLKMFTPKNAAGLPLWPELAGTYRGREVSVRGGVEFDPRLGEYDRLFRELSGASGPRLREVRQGEFTYVEVKCANPSRHGFEVRRDKIRPMLEFCASQRAGDVHRGPDPTPRKLLREIYSFRLTVRRPSRYVHPSF